VLEVSAGLMPTEARGSYLPSPITYARQRPIKLYACERVDTRQWHSQPLESTRHAGNYFVRYQYGPFLFVVAEVMSNYLTTGGLKKIISTSGGPLRPEARGICHICHVVNPPLLEVLMAFVQRI